MQGLKSNFGMAIIHHRLFREKKDRWLVPLMGFSLLGAFSLLYCLVLFIKEITPAQTNGAGDARSWPWAYWRDSFLF